jgi:hypothetical protein
MQGASGTLARSHSTRRGFHQTAYALCQPSGVPLRGTIAPRPAASVQLATALAT